MLFLSEVKVDRGVGELKVVNLEKVDIKKVDGMEFGEEQVEKISETEDGKDCFEGNQVSESSESLSQVMIMMMMMMVDMKMIMILMMMMMMDLVTMSWCCISASCTNNAFMVVTGSC